MLGQSLSVLNSGRIAVRNSAETTIIESASFVFARSDGNYVSIVSTEGQYRVRASLASVVASLAPFDVVRIHKRTAVNASRVKRVVGNGRHRLQIVLDNGAEFDVGRGLQPSIRRRFGASHAR